MAGPQIPKDLRRVIVAAAVGTVVEWYDFYIFAGSLIRPLGAFLFGWMGDRIGRKYTFLVTLSGMGLGTGAIGLIPTYEAIGLSAAFIRRIREIASYFQSNSRR